MKFQLKHIVVIVVVIICSMVAILPSFANSKKIKSKQAVTTDTLSAENRIKFNYFYLEAICQQNAGHYAAAFDLLNHALQINPNAAEVYYTLSKYYSELKRDTTALRYLEKAASLNPDNSNYLESVAQYYIGMENYDKAIDEYEEIYSRNHDRTDVLGVLIQLYQQKKDYAKMISAYERIEQVDGANDNLTLSKMNAYEQMGDKKSAYKTLKSLSDKHPNDVSYRVMLGNWLMQNDKQKDAFKLFSDALKEEPDNAVAMSSMFDYYKTIGQDSLAEELMNKILISPKTDTKSKASMMQQVIRDNEQHGGDSTKIISLLRQMMIASPKDADIAELNVAYMTLKKLPQDSINTALQQLLTIAPDNASARLQLIRVEWAKKAWDNVIALSRPAMAYNPEEMAFYYFLGLAYFQKDDQDKALDAFRRGVGEINSQSNPDIVSDFYAIMGDILHKKGLAKEAFASYDSCLQWKDDNVECLNNYAYYLSEKGENLQKAEQMSYKTIKKEPKNSTYLDTYAWILFMQKRYTESQIYIEQALKNDTDSVLGAVVLEHAGDIYALCNDVPTAMTYWERAVKAGGDSDVLLRKVRLKKYIKGDEKNK